jgi:hypothetical protein
MFRRKAPVSKKKVALVVAAVVIVAGGGAFAWHQTHKPKPVPIGGVNYGGPTKAEKKETEAHKKSLEQNEGDNQKPSTTNGKINAGVVITYLSATEARGYATNVVEAGGNCTLTLTKDSAKVTATSSAIDDVNKSTCGPISISQGQLSSGTWTAVLSYSSDKAAGSSPSQKLNVP